MIIYGIKDKAIGDKSVNYSEKYLKGYYKIEKLDAGHWLIQESFNNVSNSMLHILIWWIQLILGYKSEI